MIPQLRVSESEEFKMSSTNSNPILQRTIDPRIYLIKLLPIRRRLYFLLIFVSNYSISTLRWAHTSHSEKSVQVSNEMTNNAVCNIDRRRHQHQRSWGDEASLNPFAVFWEIAVGVDAIRTFVCSRGCGEIPHGIRNVFAAGSDGVEYPASGCSWQDLEPVDELFGDRVLVPAMSSSLGYIQVAVSQAHIKRIANVVGKTLKFRLDFDT